MILCASVPEEDVHTTYFLDAPAAAGAVCDSSLNVTKHALKEGSREQKVAEKKYWRTYSSLFQVASDEVLLAVTDFHEFAWLQKTNLRGEAWGQEFRRLYADMIIKMRKDAFEKTTLDRQVVE